MKQVPITKYADADGVVRNHIFEDCEIVGPAALVAVGVDNDIIDCEQPFTPDSAGQLRFGSGPVVLLVECTLRRCRFALDVDATQLPPPGEIMP